jgi:two-component system chemotaxis sensor kinase CheA
MVIFEVHPGARMAMPLSLVERIESVPVSEVEFAGGRAVLQYRGEVLPLEDEGDVLGSIGATSDGIRAPTPERPIADKSSAASENTQAAAIVLIFLRAGSHGMIRTAMVVRQVLDITAGTLLAEDAAGFSGQLAMVGDRVTTVHRDFTARLSDRAATLQEVA